MVAHIRVCTVCTISSPDSITAHMCYNGRLPDYTLQQGPPIPSAIGSKLLRRERYALLRRERYALLRRERYALLRRERYALLKQRYPGALYNSQYVATKLQPVRVASNELGRHAIALGAAS